MTRQGDDGTSAGSHSTRWGDVDDDRDCGGEDHLLHLGHRVDRATGGVELKYQCFCTLTFSDLMPRDRYCAMAGVIGPSAVSTSI